MALARRRKLKAAKDKEGALAPMVIKPALSRLRTATPAQRRRISKPKGGQRLMEMAKKIRRAAEKRPGGKTYVTPTPKRKTAPKKREEKGPEVYRQKRTPKYPPYYRSKKPGVAPRTTRTPSQRAADKKRWQNKMSETRSLGKLSSGMIKDLSKAQRATWEAIIGLATVPLAAAKGVHTVYKAKKAADLAKAAAKVKRAATAAKKAAEAKKGVSGIGATRAASARARTSGLGKPKPKPKPKKKKSKAQIKKESMRGASQWR